MPPHLFFKTGEVASILRVDVKTAYTDIRAGRIRAVTLAEGRVIRIPRAEVLRLLAAKDSDLGTFYPQPPSEVVVAERESEPWKPDAIPLAPRRKVIGRG